MHFTTHKFNHSEETLLTNRAERITLFIINTIELSGFSENIIAFQKNCISQIINFTKKKKTSWEQRKEAKFSVSGGKRVF